MNTDWETPAHLKEFLEECGRVHGHVCPGQVLGVRMALVGCGLVGVEEPRGRDRKSLIVWVEIDRCMADAVSVVTGLSLGRRTLKYVDYGKVAASFLNTQTREAARVVALDSARTLADSLYTEVSGKKERQMRAYTSARDEQLFKVERVSIELSGQDLPGRPTSRVTCEKCGEGVNDGREVTGNAREILCRSCSFGGYYEVL